MELCESNPREAKKNIDLVDVNHTNNKGSTPLFFASDKELVQALIDHKADVNHINNSGTPPLLKANKK